MQNRAYGRGLPRTAEIYLSLAGLALLFPLFVALAVLVKSTSKGTVFFRQKRIGLGGSEFVLYKFRSMRSDSEGLKLTAQDDKRLTGAGKWLRRYKLDELPQLWNVFRGDMSFVGPRPEVAEYVDSKNPLWQEILKVRPGITDPVALRLRNEEQLLASVEDKESFYTEILQPFKLRGWAGYARHKTWKTDLSILLRTFKVILLPNTAAPPTVEELSVAVID
ncbi:MAG TPA: sugar transferase [Pyrinomonadaceae bacterium]|jgi:lipopolysaccharide/colanic/teichoic acid biosynthesis glycosyltransferase